MFDFEIAKKEFYRRYHEYHGKEIDNSSLPAGAPMYYYCSGCSILTAVLPELWVSGGPPKYCEACKILADNGLLDGLIKEASNKPVSVEDDLPVLKEALSSISHIASLSKKKNMIYSFTLALPKVECLTDDFVDAIYEAGCSDASICQSEGLVKLCFDREAESKEMAIGTAIADVQKAEIPPEYKSRIEFIDEDQKMAEEVAAEAKEIVSKAAEAATKATGITLQDYARSKGKENG